MKKTTFLTFLALILLGCTQTTTTTTNMNPVINNILTRVSVREFTGEKISQEQIDTLLQAALAAPSAMNHQPWAFIVITEDSLLQQLGETFPSSRCDNHPACAIIPCGDLEKTLDGVAQDFWVNDLSAATENILLAAHAMGLGAVWTGLHPTERYQQMQQLLNLPPTIIPMCIIPIGVPAEHPQVKDKYQESVIHFNKW